MYKGKKLTVRAKQVAVFLHKNSYIYIENGIVEVRPRVLLVEKSSFEAKVISIDNFTTFSD